MGLEKISEYKKSLNLTNDELAKLSGVPKGTLDKILSGVTKDPKLGTLKALAKVFKCTLDDFDDNEAPNRNSLLSDKENILLENYNKLNSIGKEKLIEYSEDLAVNIKYIDNISDEITATKDNVIELNTNKENKKDNDEVFIPYTSLDQAGTTIAAHDDDLTDEEKAIADQIILDDINAERLEEWNKKHNK